MPDPDGTSKIIRTVIRRLAPQSPYSEHLDNSHAGSVLITLETLKSIFQSTEFVDQTIEVREITNRHRSASQLVRFYEARSFGNFLSFLPEDLREDFERDVIEEMEKGLAEDGIELVSKTILAVATKSI